MKKNVLIAFLLGIVGVGLLYAADPDQFVGISRGSYATVTNTAVSGSADSAILLPNAKRVDALCFNNSAFAIFIGTDSASATLILYGLPVLASATFRTDAFSDTVFAISNGATSEVRCWESFIR